MAKINIEVDVPEFAEGELRAAIIKESTRLCLERKVEENPNTGRMEILEDFQREVQSEIREEVNRYIKKNIGSVIPDAIKEVLDAGYKPVSKYGDRGEVTSLRKTIASAADAFFREKVNARGEPYYTHHPGRARTRLEYLVLREVEHVFDTKLKKLSQEMAFEVKKTLEARVSRDLQQVVSELLNLPSE